MYTMLVAALRQQHRTTPALHSMPATLAHIHTCPHSYPHMCARLFTHVHVLIHTCPWGEIEQQLSLSSRQAHRDGVIWCKPASRTPHAEHPPAAESLLQNVAEAAV